MVRDGDGDGVVGSGWLLGGVGDGPLRVFRATVFEHKGHHPVYSTNDMSVPIAKRSLQIP